jgi:hypothetical protein
MHKIGVGDYLSLIFIKPNNMKLRILKKKHPSKLERMWIKHLIEWKHYDGEYKTIKRFYIESCKKHIGV